MEISYRLVIFGLALWFCGRHSLGGADVSQLRKQLVVAEEADDKAAIIELSRRIVAIAPNDTAIWEKLAQQVSGLSLGQGEARSLRRLLFSGAADIQLDRQGRILIPQNLREYAALGEQIIVAGLNTHFEIWSDTRWREVLDTLDVNGGIIAEQLAALGI